MSKTSISYPCFLISLLLAILVNTTSAFACSCAGIPEIKEAYSKAAAIFVGRVKKIGNNPLRPSFKEIRFELIRKVKGLDDFENNHVTVYTGINSAMCGYEFSENSEYLVYASGSPARLSTNICTRNNFFDLARTEIQELSKLNESEEIDSKEVKSKGAAAETTAPPIEAPL